MDVSSIIVQMSVLLSPDFPEDPTMPLWYRITTLDGREISRTHSLGDGKWRWITDTVKGNAECAYEDIDIEETDDGEFMTVKGERYARVQPLDDFSETEEHKQAMEEREVFKASAVAQMELARLRAKINYLENEVDLWRDRYQSAEQALEATIRDVNKRRRRGIDDSIEDNSSG